VGGADASTVPADAEGAARITHDSRLKQTGELVSRFCQVAATLGDKLGALLFQLPPNLKKDLPLFEAFLGGCRQGRAAFEFRHPRGSTMCSACWRAEPRAVRRRQREAVDAGAVTADYAYFRLRDEGYTPEDIARWAEIIARETSTCRDVFVYFKHEEAGKGPEFGRLLRQRLGLPDVG
jgi:uncharacterized protein YecE (DUF72 family)